MENRHAEKMLFAEYHRIIFRMRIKVRKCAPEIIDDVLTEIKKRRREARILSNIYYLDYNCNNNTMYWSPFDASDVTDKKDLAKVRSYLEGEGELYEEMHLKSLFSTGYNRKGYLADSMREKIAGYAINSQVRESINPALDKKLGYKSCIHIPLCEDYKRGPAEEGRQLKGTSQPIGDIILAHRSIDGILKNLRGRRRRGALDKITERLYQKCNLKNEYQRIRSLQALVIKMRQNSDREFDYFFGTSLQKEYQKAISRLIPRIPEEEEHREKVINFLYRVPNMLAGVKQAMISMEEMVDRVYSDATPLVDWIKTLGEGESFLSTLGKQREHLRHIISVFMLGVIAFAAGYDRYVETCIERHLKRYRKTKSQVYEYIPKALLLLIWTLVAFSHDACYILYKFPEAASKLSNAFDRGGSTPGTSAGKTMSPLEKVCSAATLSYLLPIAMHLAEIEDIDARPRRQTQAKLERRIQEVLSGLLVRKNEHDVLAGIALQRALQGRIPGAESRLWKILTRIPPSYANQYYQRMTTTAVAHHHGCLKETKSPSLPRDFQMPKIYIDSHPLLVLLALCDGIHNWGRDIRYRYASSVKFASLRYANREMTLSLNLVCDKDKASRIVSGYKKHLARPFNEFIFFKKPWKIRVEFSNKEWKGPKRIIRLVG